MPPAAPVVPADSRLDALGALRRQAGEQIALLSLLAIGQHLRADCTQAAAVAFGWSDQGTCLTAEALLDASGKPLPAARARDVLDIIEPYCTNLGDDNEQTWGAYLAPGDPQGQQLLLRVANAAQIREPGACGGDPAEISYGVATIYWYLACEHAPHSDIYVIDVLGLRILIRRRAAGTCVHIDTQDSAQPPLLPLAVEVNNGGENTYT